MPPPTTTRIFPVFARTSMGRTSFLQSTSPASSGSFERAGCACWRRTGRRCPIRRNCIPSRKSARRGSKEEVTAGSHHVRVRAVRVAPNDLASVKHWRLGVRLTGTSVIRAELRGTSDFRATLKSTIAASRARSTFLPARDALVSVGNYDLLVVVGPPITSDPHLADVDSKGRRLRSTTVWWKLALHGDVPPVRKLGAARCAATEERARCSCTRCDEP